MVKTLVKFIKFKGDIVALFPDEPYNYSLYGNKLINSYMHFGQHSAASRSLMKLRYAKKDEYAPLMRELESIGYDLEIKQGGIKNEKSK